MMRRPERPAHALMERHATPTDVVDTQTGFVLAAGGLRRLHGGDDCFLGYTAREMFWRDLLGLVHEGDLAHAEDLIAEALERPGTALSTRLRFRDAAGKWRFMQTSIENVLEAPGDVGLVVANVTDAGSASYPERDGGSAAATR